MLDDDLRVLLIMCVHIVRISLLIKFTNFA
jgi:hypothetical protein